MIFYTNNFIILILAIMRNIPGGEPERVIDKKDEDGILNK